MRIHIDGVFKGTYSLAIVNREFARALIDAGHSVSLSSPEEGVLYDSYIQAIPEIHVRFAEHEKGEEPDLYLRNNWPINTKNMHGRRKGFFCFAWEEELFPFEYVQMFNNDLDFVAVTSSFVRKALITSGVTIPVYVTGNGVDHVLRYNTANIKSLERASNCFRFLHLSSCFPRKAPEILVNAFLEEFSSHENVELVIKTFDNIHNQLNEIVAKASQNKVNLPKVRIIKEDYSFAQINYLYKTADCFVLASHGEGFGLPLAEAIVWKVPCITTAYGGQMDFCNEDTSWLVSYTRGPSASHVKGVDGTWAIPSSEDLKNKMRSAYTSSVEERKTIAEKAMQAVLPKYEWKTVGHRFIDSLNHLKSTDLSDNSIAIVTTWKENCGIATYSEQLLTTSVFRNKVKSIMARRSSKLVETLSDPDFSDLSIIPAWWQHSQGMDNLCSVIQQDDSEFFWLQHHPGYFSESDTIRIADSIKGKSGRYGIISLHNIIELTEQWTSLECLKRFDLVFVHTVQDVSTLSSRGIENVYCIPHGIKALNRNSIKSYNSESLKIGTFGFLLPHKNTHLLLAAFKILRLMNIPVELCILSALHSNPISSTLQIQIESLIRFWELEDYVCFKTEFLEYDSIIEMLRECDLLVFPYGDTNEAATGAMRVALSSNVPVLCSDSSIFDEFKSVTHRVNSVSPEILAEAIIQLLYNKSLLHYHDSIKEKFTEQFSWNAVASRYLGHMRILLEKE